MGRKFVISDTHFNHKNIIEYSKRPFKTVEEMNEALVKNWNDTVKEDDTVFFLGDFCLGKKEEVIKFGKRLNGHKIIVLGNHDRATKTTLKEAGFETIYTKSAIIRFDDLDITIEFSHAPVDSVYPNIHGHIHNTEEWDPKDAEHFNACVEVNNYKPIPLEEAIKHFKEQ